MANANLIPAQRNATRSCNRRLRRWVTIAAAYAAALLLVYGACDAVWGSGGRAVAQELGRTAARIADSRKQIGLLQEKLFRSQRLLAANRVLSDQPDWSLLLAMLSKTLGEEIVLKSCTLTPAAAPSGPRSLLSGPTADPTGKFVLGIQGYGQSQAGVAQFVLRLEKTALFQEVKTIKIKREPFREREAVAFQLECLLLNRSETKR